MQRERVEIFYIVIWSICVVSIIVGIIKFHFVTLNIIGWLTILLLAVSLGLNFFSYYLSIILTYFLRQISNISQDLKHNQYIPSATCGFQRLQSDATMHSMVFLIVTLFYTVLYSIFAIQLFHTAAIPGSLRDNILFGLITYLSLLFGIFTFLVVFLVPKLFLRRLLERWKNASLSSFQESLYQAEEQHDTAMIEAAITKIERIQNDRLKLQFCGFEFWVAMSTVFINSIGILRFLYMVFHP